MSDSISRQDTINLLMNRADELKGIMGDLGGACNGAAKLVERLPSAEPKTKWIPVSERLPEEHEWIGTKTFGTTISDKVLVTFDVDGTRFVKPLSLQNGKLSRPDAQTMDVFHKGWKMLAWMPLPEPYREDGEV